MIAKVLTCTDRFADPYIWNLVEIGICTTMGSFPALKPLVRKAGLFVSSTKSKMSSRREGPMPGSIQLHSHIAHSISEEPGKTEGDTYELLGSGQHIYKTGVVSVVTSKPRN